MYQVELTTDMDVVSIVVNAFDENERVCQNSLIL